MGVMHYSYRDTGRTTCGEARNVVMTANFAAVTCKRCLRITERMNSKETLVQRDEKVEAGLPPAQWADIEAERLTTRRECMAFLMEGDRAAAQFRLQRGFERQCRIAGIRIGEKENA